MNAREVEKCIDDFGTDIYRFCLKLCADKTDAEDLYQQTFLKALETDWTLDPCSSYEDEIETAVHCEENIEESYLQKEFVAEIRQIIQNLPEKFQVPLILFYFSDCSIEQIAMIIKKPPGTVKSRLFKGRNLIKKRLEDAGYER